MVYVDLDRATHVEGLPEGDGRALLQSLQDHAERSARRWRYMIAGPRPVGVW